MDTITSHVSFEHLLVSVAASHQKNFILIIHGHEDGSGLWLKLTKNQGKPHTSHFDLQRLMDLDAGVGSLMSHSDHATMGIGPHEVQKILDLRHKVLDKRIDCIEFRSCNLGRNKLPSIGSANSSAPGSRALRTFILFLDWFQSYWDRR